MNIRRQFFLALLLAFVVVTPLVKADQAAPLNWALAFENDVMAGGQRDRDYTYGLNLAFTGPGLDRLKFEPSRLQSLIDQQINAWLPSSSSTRFSRRSVEYGLYGFTPDNISVSTPQLDDRPYASLIYAQSASESVDILNNTGWTQSLSVGVLGLNFVGSLQRQVHSLIDSTDAKGWNHQISDGGELTAKYTLARHRYWTPGKANWEIKTTAQASLGYISEVSYAISLRAGNIRSAWWSFKPELVSYGERSNIHSSTNWVAEHYFWAGISVKARAYNVFLQGQFRDSDHTFATNELHHGLVEVWAGYTIGLNNGYRVSYSLRGHSSEIKEGAGDRNLLWGGLTFSKTL